MLNAHMMNRQQSRKGPYSWLTQKRMAPKFEPVKSVNSPESPHQKQHVTIAEELNERVSPAAVPAESAEAAAAPAAAAEHADSSAQTVPQVTVSYEQYPPVEDHAFRTKIDG